MGLGHKNDINIPTELPYKIDRLMNQQEKVKFPLPWKIERLLWLGILKNPESNLKLLPNEIIHYIKQFL